MTERTEGILGHNPFLESDFFKVAKDLISMAGLNKRDQKDVLSVAYARSFWKRDLLKRGEVVPSYEGRHKGLVETVTDSMISKINFFENTPLLG